MTSRPKRSPLPGLFKQRRTFIARLILAEAISKRGAGPLERKRLDYAPRKR